MKLKDRANPNLKIDILHVNPNSFEAGSPIPERFKYFTGEYGETKSYKSASYARGLAKRLDARGWHGCEWLILRYCFPGLPRPTETYLMYRKSKPSHPTTSILK